MKRLFLTSISMLTISLAVSTAAQARGHAELLRQPITTIGNNILTKNYLPMFAKALETI